MCERETVIGTITAANRLLEAKGTAPGSVHHETTLEILADLLANTPGAIDELKKRQNGSSGIGEH